MKALITSIKIIEEGNCDVGYEISDDNNVVEVSGIVNIRCNAQDNDSIREHIKSVLTEIKDKHTAKKQSKLSEKIVNLLHEEIDLG